MSRKNSFGVTTIMYCVAEDVSSWHANQLALARPCLQFLCYWCEHQHPQVL